MEKILEWMNENNIIFLLFAVVILGIVFKRKNDKYLIGYNKYQKVIYYINKEELKTFKTDLKKLSTKQEKKILIDMVYEQQLKKREEELKKNQERIKKMAEKYQ